MSRGSTEFCIARMMLCMFMPSPKPNSAMKMSVRHSGVSAPMVDMSSSAPTISVEPITGKIL